MTPASVDVDRASAALVASAACASRSAAALAKPEGSAAPATPALHLRSIDLGARSVLIEVTGISQAPAPNLFTFTDDARPPLRGA